MEERASAYFTTASGVAGAVRGHQRVQAQLPPQRFLRDFDLGVHEQHRPVRISEHVLYNAIAALWFRIGEPVKDAIALRIFDAVIQVTLFLVAKRFAVGDKKLKVARIRLIDLRIVNLIDDTVAEREPKPATGVIGRAHALLRARSPPRLDSGRTKRH